MIFLMKILKIISTMKVILYIIVNKAHLNHKENWIESLVFTIFSSFLFISARTMQYFSSIK
jgi:hypothetical protein